jgi:hypothetical protein
MPERRGDGNIDRRFGDAILLNLEVSNAILRLRSERSGACRGCKPNRIARIVSDHSASAKGEGERASVNACDRDIDGPFDEAAHKLVQPFLAPQDLLSAVMNVAVPKIAGACHLKLATVARTP